MATKKFHSLEKLIATAVKVGHNEKEAISTIAKSYEYIKRKYPNASAKRTVNIAYTIF